LHDTLPSNIRAGSSSTVGAITQLLYVPMALLFGHVSQLHTIFSAAWIVVGLCVFVLLGILVNNRQIANYLETE
jgi:hypothetical protein